MLKDNDLHYPLLFKPDIAVALKSSHYLALAFNDEGLA